MTPEAAVLAWADELRECGDDDRRRQLRADLERAVAELDDWLRRAWAWLDANPGAADVRSREERLIGRLRTYERGHAALRLARLRDGAR